MDENLGGSINYEERGREDRTSLTSSLRGTSAYRLIPPDVGFRAVIQSKPITELMGRDLPAKTERR